MLIENRQDQLDASTRENVMRASFWQRADVILANPDAFIKKPQLKIGIELEMAGLTPDFAPITSSTRDSIISEKEFFDVELGAAQMELRTDPFDLKEGGGVTDVLEQLEERVDVLTSSASRNNSLVLLHGTNPFVKLDQIERTQKEKYRLVPDFHNQRRRKDINTVIGTEGVDIGDAAIISLANACHLNMQAESLEDATDKMNRAFSIGPSIIAIAGNSRFLEESDTGMGDVRLIAWQLSHDTRTDEEIANGLPTRVGMPRGYFRGVKDYFEEVSSYPFILDNPDHALEVGIGLFWKDVRLKFYDSTCVVEFRPVPTQPTVSENMAVHTFFLGRLLWSQKHDEKLLPIEAVKFNRIGAMVNGTGGNMWTLSDSGELVQAPTVDVLQRDIMRSKEGLRDAQISGLAWATNAVDELKKRLTEGNPSEQLGNRVTGQKGSLERRESLITALTEGGIQK